MGALLTARSIKNQLVVPVIIVIVMIIIILFISSKNRFDLVYNKNRIVSYSAKNITFVVFLVSLNRGSLCIAAGLELKLFPRLA